jgi:hypothetical protein
LFLPLYLCENNIIKALPLGLERPIKDTDYRLNNAIKYMPGNPYAWTYKFTFDSEQKLYAAFNDSNARSYEEYYGNIEKIFGDIFHDLDRINSIIPGYQDVWSKYGQVYFLYYRYLEDKFGKTGKMSDLENSKKYMESALSYYNKSIDMNFLDQNSHMHKLFLLKKMDNKIQFNEALSHLITARIYVDFARGRRIVKENINIGFSETEQSGLKVENGTYHFTVKNGDVKMIMERDYLIDQYENMSQTLNEDITNFFNVFKNDKLTEPDKSDNANKPQGEEP